MVVETCMAQLFGSMMDSFNPPLAGMVVETLVVAIGKREQVLSTHP
ncbi:hypothetical protein QUB80_21960 [Chlorogloeopsis sp. ULAP01]|nr:hypothetical protein [Chlorogloeopsis sp. ULAP01]MDM9383362.1 hypothetical protein [Chlorogloeopsis sp. ULAP01]